MLSDTVGDQVAEWRKRAGWSRERLAEECAKAGMPELSPSVINNIETGRTKGRQARRRFVSVDELAVIAAVLGIPPVLLLAPYPHAGQVEICPGRVVPSGEAAEWISGTSTIFPSDNESQDRPVRWSDAVWPLNYLRSHNQLFVHRRTTWHNLRMMFVNPRIEREHPDPESDRGPAYWEARQMAEIVRLDELDKRIQVARNHMRDSGWPVPDLPNWLAHLDAQPDPRLLPDVGSPELEVAVQEFATAESDLLLDLHTRYQLARQREEMAYADYREIGEDLAKATEDELVETQRLREMAERNWMEAAIAARRLAAKIELNRTDATGSDTPDLSDQLVAQYERGVSIQALTEWSGRPYGWVQRVLTERGVRLRGRAEDHQRWPKVGKKK